MAADEKTPGEAEAPARPVLRIVKGNPTPEELAALTVVLAAASQGGEEETPTSSVGGWSDPASHVRAPLRPGHGAWRSSAWQ